MPQIPQVQVVKGNPLGAAFDVKDETVHLTFVSETGDHLDVVLDRHALETLCRHIERVREQLPAQTSRP